MGRILVVDDERSIRITVKAFLEADGHQVATAEDSETALDILKNTLIDVVLTDIILPRISGVDLLRQIRKMFPEVQVVMMTGEPTLETASESLRFGAMDYLQKPVTKNDILKSVRNAAHVRQLNDEKRRLEEENRKYVDRLEQLVSERTCALAESENALRQRAEELTILNRLAREVNAGMTVDTAVRAGLHEITMAVRPDLAIVFLLEENTLKPNWLLPEEATKTWQPDVAHRVGECLCGLAVAEDNPVYSADILTDRRCTLEECKKAGFSSFVALPLKSGTEFLGVLGLASEQPRDFNQSGPFLEALATELSIGLKKNLLYEQLQQHAMELQGSISRIKEGEAERLLLQGQLQQAQKMEAIGTLASGIAHDFNNILGAVLGYAELAALETTDGSSLRKHLEMVMSAAYRAKDLVRQILAFSRQSNEERKPINVAHITKEVLKFMRASLPATIDIRGRIEPVAGNIFADPTQIHQIIMNLCTNAHHAMREHGGVLEVSLASVHVDENQASNHPELKAGPYVRLTVNDTGQGMDEQILARIFDPYFTTKEKGVGTGLGLAVVHGIVTKYGGCVVVESTPGKGSRFDLYFPAIQEAELPALVEKEEMPRGKERILFIDDEQPLIEIGRQMLVRLGYEVVSTSSSIDGLNQFLADPGRFDLVISDMTMPNITGDVLAKKIMEIDPRVPIILCTGFSERISEAQARSLGISALLMKPLGMRSLAKTVRSALDSKRVDESQITTDSKIVASSS